MGVSEEPPGETNEDDTDAVGDEVDPVEELEKEIQYAKAEPANARHRAEGHHWQIGLFRW